VTATSVRRSVLICTWSSEEHSVQYRYTILTIIRSIAPESLWSILARASSALSAKRNLRKELACVSFSQSDTQSSRSLASLFSAPNRGGDGHNELTKRRPGSLYEGDLLS
jgi:hypothetical protein